MNSAQYEMVKWHPIDVCRVQSGGGKKLHLIVRDFTVYELSVQFGNRYKGVQRC